MGREKRMMNAIKDKRVVAIPTKKKKVEALDEFGNPILDKKGFPTMKEVQYYRIRKLQ